MPSVQITLCSLCTKNRPDILHAINTLLAKYPGRLCVVDLECMAACDDVPAVMLECDYFPQVTPQELFAQVEHALAA